MNFYKSKIPSVVVLASVMVMFIGTLVMARLFTLSLDIYRNPASIIKGVYSIDDGPWTEIDLKKPIEDPFRKIVFKWERGTWERGTVPLSHFYHGKCRDHTSGTYVITEYDI